MRKITARFTNHTGYSASSCVENDGKIVEVSRKLTRDEVDTEVGVMYRVKSSDGDIFDAFGDELDFSA